MERCRSHTVTDVMTAPSGDERARLLRIRRMALARRLRELRHDRGWSQETVARKAGVDRSFYADLELGNHSPRVDMLWDLAAAYGVQIRDLFPDSR
jgi:DNA-binding XRE family transcriptional regulator